MTKLELASPEWIAKVGSTIKDLVTQSDPADGANEYSSCEVFTNPPARLLSEDAETIAWSYRIKGSDVVVEAKEADDVDFKIVLDYEAARPLIKFIHAHDPEKMAELAVISTAVAMDRKVKVLQHKKHRPPAIASLHDRIASFTA